MNAAPTTPDRRDPGTTLIELVITLAVMSVAMVIIAATLIAAQRATNSVERSSAAIDAARLASARLDRELRSAVCISSPVANDPAAEKLVSSNTLKFDTVAGSITYVVVDGTLTRSAGLGPALIIIHNVGKTDAAFTQLATPLRTILVTIPIVSQNGGEFLMQTTIAGRNAWRAC